MLPIGLSILTLTLRMSACHIVASALNVTFAKTIARCLSTMSWAVNTCLGIASNTESTSLLCWPSGAGARHRRRMSQGCSLGLERLGLETVSRRFSNVSASSRSRRSKVSVSSRSRDSNVSVSSRSRLLTSRLHRISKFKLRTVTIKFSILYRDTWAA